MDKIDLALQNAENVVSTNQQNLFLYMLKQKWFKYEVLRCVDSDSDIYPFHMWLSDYFDKLSGLIDGDYLLSSSEVDCE